MMRPAWDGNDLRAKFLDIKEKCVHLQRFEILQHAVEVLGDLIEFYKHRRPHQALKMKTTNQPFDMF